MNFNRIAAIVPFVLAAAAVAVTDARPAEATNPSCAAYSTCVSNLEGSFQRACTQLRQQARGAKCPEATPQQIAAQCGNVCASNNASGSFRTKYMVVSVLYSPPGSAGKTQSNVDYGTASTAGSNLTTSNSYKVELSSEASVTAGAPMGDNLTVDVTLTGSTTTGSTNALDLKKKQSQDVKAPGPTTDGIDHNQDIIWVLLSPIVNLTVNGTSVVWSLSADQSTLPQYARIGWLKNPATMPADVAAAFTAAGLTTADFQTMIARDPYAWYPGRGPGVQSAELPAPPDPARFVYQDTVPYEPDPSQTSVIYALSSESTTTTTTTAQDSTSVGISVSASGGLASWLKVSLKDSATWTWTSSSTQSSSTDWTQSATATVVSPSAAYQGPTDLMVYFDTIYRTFLFMPTGAGSIPVLSGVILDPRGQPMEAADVLVTVGSTHVHAFTDRKGTYRVYNLPPGSASVSYASMTRSLALGSGTARADFVSKGLNRGAIHSFGR